MGGGAVRQHGLLDCVVIIGVDLKVRLDGTDLRVFTGTVTIPHHSAPTTTWNSGKSGNPGLASPESATYRHGAMAMAATENIHWDSFHGRMIEARTRRGLTRLQAARKAGYKSDTTLRRYELATGVPREDIVFRYAEVYGCDLFWLMYGRGEPGWREP
jgi:hypothetical protein